MHRQFTPGTSHTVPGPSRQVSWYPEPLVKAQDISVPTTMTVMTKKKNQGRWGDRSDTLQRIRGSRVLRCDEEDVTNSWSQFERVSAHNEFPEGPYVASSPRSQDPLHDERDIAYGTSSPPSSIATTTLVNGSAHPVPHPHPNFSFPHKHEATLTPAIFSIRQQHPAHPNDDFCAEFLKRHPNCPNMRYLPLEISNKVPKTGNTAVRLHHPNALLSRRVSERRRKNQILAFAPTATVHEYGHGMIDMPLRSEGTKFHDDGNEFKHVEPWPRNRLTGRRDQLDAMHQWQAHGKEAGAKMFRYDGVKKDYVRTTLEEAKDLSGREERMREKVRAKREQSLEEGMIDLAGGDVGGQEKVRGP